MRWEGERGGTGKVDKRGRGTVEGKILVPGEGPIRRLCEWGPIKISPKKVGTTPKSRSWIPTRTCQGHVVTMDLPTLGTSPNELPSGSTTQGARDLGKAVCLRWTVRPGQADGPSRPGGRSDPTHPTRRTVRNNGQNLQNRPRKIRTV
jgi:hypothetical protein